MNFWIDLVNWEYFNFGISLLLLITNYSATQGFSDLQYISRFKTFNISSGELPDSSVIMISLLSTLNTPSIGLDDDTDFPSVIQWVVPFQIPLTGSLVSPESENALGVAGS